MGKAGRPKITGDHMRSKPRKPPGRLTKPRGLGKHGAWVWDLIVGSMADDQLGAVDAIALKSACELYEIWQRYKDSENRFDFQRAANSLRQAEGILKKFGWTPQDRRRLRPKVAEPPDSSRFFGVRA